MRTIGEHWGAGLGASVRQSTFFNLDPSYRAAAALEWNLYPYSISSRRAFTLTYFVGATRFDYESETIFDRSRETLIDQGLIASLDLEQPWGSASFEVETYHFLQQPDDFNVELSADLEYRITRGLSLDVFGSYTRVRSQRFLPKGGASDEEVLLERRALETNYRFWFNIGISYTFGSIYNNIVNARLTGPARGFNTIF